MSGIDRSCADDGVREASRRATASGGAEEANDARERRTGGPATRPRTRVESSKAMPRSSTSRVAALMDARYTREGPKSPGVLEDLADRLVSLFTPDAVWSAAVRSGPPWGSGRFASDFAPTLQYSWHFFVSRDRRGSRRGSWDVCDDDDEGRRPSMVGVERRYRRVDGRWLHSKMHLESQLMALTTAAGGRGQRRASG